MHVFHTPSYPAHTFHAFPVKGRNSFTACLELVRGAALVTSFHQHLAITRQVRLMQAYQPGSKCWL